MTQKQIPEDKKPDSLILEELSLAEEVQPVIEPVVPESAESTHEKWNRTIINDIIKLSDNPNLALLVLDTDLTILHSTPKAAMMFRHYYPILPKPFFNVFHQTLGQEEMKDLVISLRSYERG